MIEPGRFNHQSVPDTEHLVVGFPGFRPVGLGQEANVGLQPRPLGGGVGCPPEQFQPDLDLAQAVVVFGDEVGLYAGLRLAAGLLLTSAGPVVMVVSGAT